MKIAIVHDFLREWGGAEEVLVALHQIWPDAPIYTSYVSGKAFHFQKQETDDSANYQWNLSHGEFLALNNVELRTTWMDHLPDALKTSKLLTFLLPFAFSSFSFRDYDVVISNTASFAKSIDIQSPTIHICYCNTPPRFLYGLQRERSKSQFLDAIEGPIDFVLRWLDQQAAKRVDYFVANSGVVAERIKKVYGKDATVIYPPVDLEKFIGTSMRHPGGEVLYQPVRDFAAPGSDFARDGMQNTGPGQARMTISENQKYFMTVGRLSPIKQFDLAVKACTKLGLPLKVVGSGGDEVRLRSLAGSTIEFLGRKSDDEIAQLLINCKAVINPIFDEDFGLVPLEVLAAGVPVIAFASEAAKESLDPGITGEFFTEPTVESLSDVLQNFDKSKYNPNAMRKHAEQFSKETFVQKMANFVDNTTKNVIASD